MSLEWQAYWQSWNAVSFHYNIQKLFFYSKFSQKVTSDMQIWSYFQFPKKIDSEK